MVITNVLKSKCGKILKTLNDTFEEKKKLKEKILENSKDLRDLKKKKKLGIPEKKEKNHLPKSKIMQK